MQRHLYPANWDATARAVKDAAGWVCQQCGRPCRRPGETLYDFVLQIEEDWAGTWAKDLYDEEYDPTQAHFLEEFSYVPVLRTRRFVLSVAHLNHRPEDCRPENLKALCMPCRGRMNLTPSALAAKRALKLERQGQLRLDV